MTNISGSKPQKVQDALKQGGYTYQVIEMPESTRSAREAAEALGCQVAQIAKSLVFKGRQTQKPYLVIASGINRVNEAVLNTLVGEPIEKASADFVLEKTGFAIGGVPPLGHIQTLKTLIDEDLLQYEQIWAAAGSSHAVFQLASADLAAMTGGMIVRIL